MLYNIVLDSAIYQHESAKGIHMPPPSHLSANPIPLGCLRAFAFPVYAANSHWLPDFTYGNVYALMLFFQFVTQPRPVPSCPQLLPFNYSHEFW